MSKDGQCTKWRRKIAENFNRLSRVHERHRQTTDGRAIAYSKREREFTFAKTVTVHGRWVHRSTLRPVDFPNDNNDCLRRFGGGPAFVIICHIFDRSRQTH